MNPEQEIGDLTRDKVGNAQTKTNNLTKADFDSWAVLISSINHHHPAAAKWSRKMQWPGNGRVQQALGLSDFSGHGQGTCAWRMQPDATWHVCATSTHLEAARAGDPGLPIVALAEERQRRVVRWAGGEFWSAEDANGEGENCCRTQ